MEGVDTDDYIDALEKNNKELINKNLEISSSLSNVGAINKNENLIQYQIENTE